MPYSLIHLPDKPAGVPAELQCAIFFLAYFLVLDSDCA